MNLPTENALTAEPATVAASMKLAILGATGSVGHELVAQVLAAGHEVTALVRAQPKPGEIDDRVALVIGDATSADAVKCTVQGRDAVLSALGHAKGAPDDLLAQVSSNLIAAMQADGVSRLVVLSSAAVVDAATSRASSIGQPASCYGR